MDLQQIEKLVQIIENSSMLEFSIQEGDTKIKMSRRGTAGVPGERTGQVQGQQGRWSVNMLNLQPLKMGVCKDI